MTDTVDRPKRPFRKALTPVQAPPEMNRFAAAMRRLQDLAVSAAPEDDDVWATAASHVNELAALLEAHAVPPDRAPAGRATGIPGLGHPLMPPWTATEMGPGGVTMRGRFSRFHVGGNSAVHGGVIPLLFDWHFGMIVSAAARPISRTAYLHVDYRRVTPIDDPLVVRGGITSVDGRKAYVESTLSDLDGAVLCEARALMVALLPHHR